MKETIVRYAIEEGYRGLCLVRMDYRDSNGDRQSAYLQSSYKGNYKWTIGFWNAQKYSKATAEKHIKALKEQKK